MVVIHEDHLGCPTQSVTCSPGSVGTVHCSVRPEADHTSTCSLVFARTVVTATVSLFSGPLKPYDVAYLCGAAAMTGGGAAVLGGGRVDSLSNCSSSPPASRRSRSGCDHGSTPGGNYTGTAAAEMPQPVPVFPLNGVAISLAKKKF